MTSNMCRPTVSALPKHVQVLWNHTREWNRHAKMLALCNFCRVDSGACSVQLMLWGSESDQLTGFHVRKTSINRSIRAPTACSRSAHVPHDPWLPEQKVLSLQQTHETQ